MKTLTTILTVIFVAMFLIGCSGLPDLVQRVQDAETIQPSDNIISETRDVTDFTSIDMRTFGSVVITQGDSESLTVEGSDNILPLIRTSVRDGKLIIDTTRNIRVLNLDTDKVLIFNITVKDLTELIVSGAGRIQMDALSTSRFNLDMSGAGEVNIDRFTADELDVTISGAGSLDIAGQATRVSIDIPGAGSVNAGDLECQTATVNISGLGSATVWVTGHLSGTISGAGSVNYYGNPDLQTSTSGLGSYHRLGDK